MEPRVERTRILQDSPATTDRSVRAPNHANEVVIPHAGQGLPVILKNEQGRIPSCSCVPKPRGRAPASSPGPEFPGFRRQPPKGSIGPANPADEPHRTARPRLAPRSRRYACAERARKQGPGQETEPYPKRKIGARGIGRANRSRDPWPLRPSVETQVPVFLTVRALPPRLRLRAWLPACGARLRGGTLRSYRGRRRAERGRLRARRRRRG